MLHSSKWNVLYMFVSVLGLLLSLASDFKSRSACYAFCLLDVSVRYRAMHRCVVFAKKLLVCFAERSSFLMNAKLVFMFQILEIRYDWNPLRCIK